MKGRNRNGLDSIPKLYTLHEAEKILLLGAVTLRKYANRGMIGVKLGSAPEPGQADRRPWYPTDSDVEKVRAMPREAHSAGRPRKARGNGSLHRHDS